MWPLFKHKLLSNWGMILGWGVGLGLLGFFMFGIYDSFIDQNIDLMQIMEAMPSEFMVFFGDQVDPTSPEGFLTVEFFSYIPVILGFVVISNASGLITGKEEDGTLELLIAQPISRSVVFWSRFAALLLSLLLILVITWAGFAIGAQTTDVFDVSMVELLRPFVSLLSLLLLFLGLALFLSMVLPSTKATNIVSGFVLIASYFINSLARIEDSLSTVNKFLPFRYYETGEALQGLNSSYVLLLLGTGTALILLAWLTFAKRDLHFGITSGLRIVLPKIKKITRSVG